MQDVNLTTRYLNAYVGKGTDKEQVKRLTELKLIIKGLENNQAALNQLTSDAVSKENKEELIQKVLSSQNTRCLSLFKLLIKKNRMNLIEKFDQIIEQMIESRLDEKTATINCESDYSETEKKKIESIIEKQLKTKIKANYQSNPEIIGGFKAIVGNQMIDCSIKHILMQFKESALSNT